VHGIDRIEVNIVFISGNDHHGSISSTCVSMCSCECLDCGKTNLIERESQITEGMRMFGNMELEVITILILHLPMRSYVLIVYVPVFYFEFTTLATIGIAAYIEC